MTNSKSSCGDGKSSGAKSCCSRCTFHFNSLWSVWYGLFGGAFQVCIALKCIKRLLNYSIFPWPSRLPLPTFEMNACLILTGLGILMIPFFAVSAIFKVGNLANDGHKLGRHLNVCSKEVPSELLKTTASHDCNFWRYGGPTSPFLHSVVAFCFLLPKLLMEARLVEANIFPQDMVWHTDLDFLTVPKDRSVILSFMTLTANDSMRSYNSKLQAELEHKGEDLASADLNAEQNTSTVTLANSVVNVLKKYIGTYDVNFNIVEYEHENHISIEYINFALALAIYAVRYSSLFWATNKCLSIIFSTKLILNGVQILLSYAGVSILYKVQIMGADKVLPFFKHLLARSPHVNKESPFLLSPLISVMLYVLYMLLIFASSLVFYLYGHTRFKNFLNRNCHRKTILIRERSTSMWTYFTHTTALCLLIAIAVCSAPLFYDYTTLYRGSLDGVMLACIIGGILHLFLWVVLWLFLTIKEKWIFNLRITVGKMQMKQSTSIQVAADIFTKSSKRDDNFSQPLLVASNGYIYSVTENTMKNSIIGVLRKDLIRSRDSSDDMLCSSDNKSEDEIYWLKSKLLDSNQYKHIKDESPMDAELSHICINDDGDYATLKQPEIAPDSEDIIPCEIVKASDDDHLIDVQYAANNQNLLSIQEDRPTVSHAASSPSKYAQNEDVSAAVVHDTVKKSRHKCGRKTQGPGEDEPSMKYDSISVESSTSPPDNPDSETSSGVHSNESTEQQLYNCAQQNILPQDIKLARVVEENREAIRNRVRWHSHSLNRCSSSGVPEVIRANTNKYYSLNPNLSAIHEQFINNKSNGTCGMNQPKTSSESTLIICRKFMPHRAVDKESSSAILDDKFGRSTNMRMSSFTESNSNRALNSLDNFSYYSTGGSKHCSTMPPTFQANFNPSKQSNCQSSQRHHTIPSHHNGVQLFTDQSHG